MHCDCIIALAFERFILSHSHLEHARTRHYAPQANGRVERFDRSLKYEHLYRLDIDTADELARKDQYVYERFWSGGSRRQS